MTNKHTPGPWRVMKANPALVVGGSLGYLVANCQNGRKSNDEDEANARLISAAPDMLEALYAVIRVADRKTDEFDAARAAIAKATGQALQDLSDIGQELNI